MDDLLTSKQVQELLKIERITVYRLLNDRRLQGVKIGKQWRFPASQFEQLQSLDKTNPSDFPTGNISLFPVHCMQTIQNLISDLRDIPTLIVDTQGNPLTDYKKYCALCQTIQKHPDGEQMCLKSWQKTALTRKHSGWKRCHAGLSYYFYALQENGKTIAYLLAGQFRMADDEKQLLLTQQLAASLQIDEEIMTQHFQNVPGMDAAQQKQIERWIKSAATALEEIFIERTDLLKRLQQIAKISQIQE